MKHRIIGKFIGRDHGTVYPCSNCGADTRDTGHGELGNELCAECQDEQEVEAAHESHDRAVSTCPLCMKRPVKVKLTLATFRVFPSFKRKFHMVKVTKEQVMVTGEREALELLCEYAAERDFEQEDDFEVPIWFFNTASATHKALCGALWPEVKTQPRRKPKVKSGMEILKENTVIQEEVMVCVDCGVEQGKKCKPACESWMNGGSTMYQPKGGK